MPYNGAGSFSPLHNWQDDANDGIDIVPDRQDEQDEDIATGLSNVICKDGQTTITANIPFSGFKITGYGSTSSPSARTDVPNIGTVVDGTILWSDSAGTVDAITATYAPAITSLVNGMIIGVRASGANTITNPTFSPNGLTARTIVKNGGQALVAGDIYGDGHEILLRYDSSNTRWELLNPAANRTAISAASSGANTDITSIYLNNTGLKIKDTNASHGLSIVPGSDLSADRTLTITSGDADRSLGITANIDVSAAVTISATTNISGALTVSGTTNISGVAAQSDMETASSTTLIVTPGRQQYHPSACKAWVIFNGTGGTPTVLASYNVTGVSKLYTGGYEVTIATDFSSANYGVATTARSTSFRQLIHMIAFGGAPAAGTIALESFNSASSALADVELFSVVMFGDQ